MCVSEYFLNEKSRDKETSEKKNLMTTNKEKINVKMEERKKLKRIEPKWLKKYLRKQKIASRWCGKKNDCEKRRCRMRRK